MIGRYLCHRLAGACLLALAIVIALLPYPAGAAQPAAGVRVVVTIKPVHSLVAAVMAGAGSPLLLIRGAGSPHSYALKPSEARALNQAALVIRVSADLELFLARNLAGLPPRVRVMTLSGIPGLRLHNIREGGVFADHDHGHVDKQDRNGGHDRAAVPAPIDPHIWLDPDNAIAIARHAAVALAALDPGRAALYRANAEGLSERLHGLTGEIERELQPLAGKRYVVFHDAYQYFEQRFGLRPAGSVTLSPDQPPGSGRIQALRRLVRERRASCLFAEPQFAPKLLQVIAEGTGARIATLDPLGIALPEGPQMYAALMRRLAGDLRGCLGR